jgi:hypothetical protein
MGCLWEKAIMGVKRVFWKRFEEWLEKRRVLTRQ